MEKTICFAELASVYFLLFLASEFRNKGGKVLTQGESAVFARTLCKSDIRDQPLFRAADKGFDVDSTPARRP